MVELEDLFAQVLIEERDSGSIYRSSDGGILLSDRTKASTDRPDREDWKRVFEIADGRIRYWDEESRRRPLVDLTKSLRRRQRVRLAVLYGSRARGDEAPLSDIDLLVRFGPTSGEPSESASPRLAAALKEKLGLHVDVITLAEAGHDPILMYDVLTEGEVIVDRDRLWPSLLAKRDEIDQLAERASDEPSRKAREAVDRMRRERE